MRRLPPLGSLQAFVHVARLGSLKAAAESLALSSPALTRRLQTLEQFVGTPLLERQHNSIYPNAEGERLLADIAPNIDALALAIERVGASGAEIRLRLAVPSLFGSQWLVPALPGLRERFGNLHIDMDTGPNRLARLDEGIDAAIVIASEVDPRLHSRLIRRDRMVVLGSSHFAEGPDAIREPADLARVPILLHSDMPDSFTAWSEGVGLGGLKPKVVSYYDSGQMILNAAAEGLGVALMLTSHLEASNDNRLMQLFDQTVDSPYAYWFVCTRAAMERRSVKMFYEWLSERVDVA